MVALATEISQLCCEQIAAYSVSIDVSWQNFDLNLQTLITSHLLTVNDDFLLKSHTNVFVTILGITLTIPLQSYPLLVRY